jgi:hypothetical protein
MKLDSISDVMGDQLGDLRSAEMTLLTRRATPTISSPRSQRAASSGAASTRPQHTKAVHDAHARVARVG